MMRIIAVDWSGAQSGAENKIWLAEVEGSRVTRLESGRSRRDLIRHLASEAARDPELVVGLDFAFSFPGWYLTDHGLGSAPELWELADTEGERWLGECEPPFWGRPGRKRPDHYGFRRTELDVRDRFSAQPKSAFQIGGGGAVGTMSVRGMPFLSELARAGFSIWPFDPAELPLVVEIYPRLLTGGLVKSDRRARELHLRGAYPELDVHQGHTAAASEDALDAAVSAVVMARHVDELLHLPDARDEVDRLEGRIWYPADVAAEPGMAREQLELRANGSESAPPSEHDLVVLERDLPEHGLIRGDMGAVVHVYHDGKAYEVEFVLASGETAAVLTLDAEDVRPRGGRELLHARSLD